MGHRLDARNILKKEPPSREFLEKHIQEENLKVFISTRSPRYKALGWNKRLPSKRAAIAEMLRSPNLIKRPVIVEGARVHFGFDKKQWGD